MNVTRFSGFPYEIMLNLNILNVQFVYLKYPDLVYFSLNQNISRFLNFSFGVIELKYKKEYELKAPRLNSERAFSKRSLSDSVDFPTNALSFTHSLTSL